MVKTSLKRMLSTVTMAVVLGAMGAPAASAEPIDLDDICIPTGDLEDDCRFPW
jgi:hypothetical protein